MKPKLLDLFCGAGGCGMGYSRAGFEVVGIDRDPQPQYPFDFHQADALEYLAAHGHEFDFIHASPPCQRYSTMTPKHTRDSHPDLLPVVVEILRKFGKPYCIENVAGARKLLNAPLLLCGTMFNLKTRRHRFFETSFTIFSPATCNHSMKQLFVTTKGSNSITAHAGGKSVKFAPEAYGIDWMDFEGLREAVPPAYCEYIGVKARAHLTKHAPDVGESAPLNPLSTPEVDSDLGKVSASRPTLVM